MASTRRKTTKSGAVFYEIRVKASREVPELSKRWYVPEGWSQKSIDRELAKVAAEFERQCKAGEILTKREQRERKTQEKQEAAKIPTLRPVSYTHLPNISPVHVVNLFCPIPKATVAVSNIKVFLTGGVLP